jgi:Mn-dependent DtxR family transcriptional regulator
MDIEKQTQSVEDYLERIYELIREKGYVRPVEIAEKLSIKQSAVTRMIKNLDVKGYVNYTKYRGLTLTKKGEIVARGVHRRHQTIARLLRLLGVKESVLQQDAEGIEHYMSTEALHSISLFAEFLESKRELLEDFKKFKKQIANSDSPQFQK